MPTRSWPALLAFGVWLLLALVTLCIAPANAQGLVDAMRGPTPVANETKPPLLFPTENKDIRRTRNYTMQPPTIPHKIDGYQLDRDFNRCMFCHARTKSEETGSIPVSITHYMDRDNNVLAEVSPRRYFCTQCHVPQADTKPLVGNSFVDVETMLKRAGGEKGAKDGKGGSAKAGTSGTTSTK
ncbi:nitrate reductase cytochrome c-type subunit; periplasmic nitrate reductase electron transfer subunit [Cupriavidus sp. SW-Y-13]|nr:nitrate reductase cytochrome c-type subunit [Cupriavidus sp. SW-Y-13]MWL90220.1 nitrate reductase cytochrome c-type subunit; periplasmic nitrate reductase electron transfer subunit [Cupriavidus sp. SW-Y-13]